MPYQNVVHTEGNVLLCHWFIHVASSNNVYNYLVIRKNISDFHRWCKFIYLFIYLSNLHITES